MKDRLLPLGFILLLAGLLAPILRDFMREIIVIPLLYAFWWGRFLSETIPQASCWGVFCLVAALIASRSLLKQPRSKLTTEAPELPQPGRVESWVKLLQQATQEDYYKWRLARRLREVTTAMLADEQRLSPKQINQQLRAGSLDIPPDIQQHLQASLISFPHLLKPRPRFRSGAQGALDLEPERVVQFLEDRLPDE